MDEFERIERMGITKRTELIEKIQNVFDHPDDYDDREAYLSDISDTDENLMTVAEYLHNMLAASTKGEAMVEAYKVLSFVDIIDKEYVAVKRNHRRCSAQLDEICSLVFPEDAE